MQRVAFLPWTEFHDTFFADVLDESLENLATQALAGHLASAEENGGLYLVALGKEAKHVVLLGLVVMVVHIDAELHFFDHDLVLVLLGRALTLFLLVEVFAVIHNAANRRLRRGRNLYQVQVFFAGHLERFERGHHAQLVSCVVDHANFADANALVCADKTLIDTVLQSNCRKPKYSTVMQALCATSVH